MNGGCHFAYGGHGGGYYEPQAWQGQAGNYSEDQEVDWHEIRQAEWLQHIQNQYFSRWSVDKQDEWQAYQAKFNSAQDAAWNDQKETQASQASASSSGRRSAQEYRKQHEMKVISSFSGSVPQPIQDFEAAGLPEKVLKEIQDAKFSEPTPIQAQCWPILSNGHDLIGIAKSGSGKTLALGPGRFPRRGVFPRGNVSAAMDCLPKRPPGPVTKQIPRLDEAIASLQELQEEGEVEAAMGLLLRLITIDESVFCTIFPHADGATLGVTDVMGRTLLHYAATLGRLAALSLLLACEHLDPNCRDDRGDTALHLAAGNGERGACELLLKHRGVDRSLQDEDGRTALDLAHSSAAHYFATEAVHALQM